MSRTIFERRVWDFGVVARQPLGRGVVGSQEDQRAGGSAF